MTTLDFSKFPKIIPGDDSQENKQRSQSIVDIKEIMNNLVLALESYVNGLLEFDNKAKILDQREANLKEDELTLSDKEKKVYELEDRLKEEKKYIAQANLDLKEREAKIESNHDYLEEIQIEKEAYEERKAEAIRQEGILAGKIAQLKKLEELRAKLEEREAIVSRSEAIDAERKRLLDIREQRIAVTESRLHIEQEE